MHMNMRECKRILSNFHLIKSKWTCVLKGNMSLFSGKKGFRTKKKKTYRTHQVSYLCNVEDFGEGGRGDGDSAILPGVTVLSLNLTHQSWRARRVLSLGHNDGRGERQELRVVVVDVCDGDVHLGSRVQAIHRLVHSRDLEIIVFYIHSVHLSPLQHISFFFLNPPIIKGILCVYLKPLQIRCFEFN